MTWWLTALAGVAAGLGLAAPLGAVGVLLLREGLAVGFRRAWPAGAAVATVDGTYCALALTVGGRLAPLVTRLGPWPALAAGALLVGVGAVGLVRSRQPTGTAAERPTLTAAGRATGGVAAATAGSVGAPEPGATVVPAVEDRLPPTAGRSRRRRFAGFVALTAVNPATLVYVAALAVGMRGVLASAGAAVVFTLALAGTSLAWQLGLVAVGGALGSSVSRRTARAVSLVGYGTVVVLGGAAVVTALV